MTQLYPVIKSPPRLRLHIAEWLGLWALLLALGGYIAYSEYLTYQQIEASERVHLASQAKVVERTLAAQLYADDRALQLLRTELARGPSKGAGIGTMNDYLEDLSKTLTGIADIFVINASGKIIHSSAARMVGFDASGQDFFQLALKQHNPDTLFVTPSLTRAMGGVPISLVREISDARGQFDGVVMATLDRVFYGVLLESIRFTPDTTSVLAHGDGDVLVAAPVDETLLGKDMAVPSSFFSQHRNSGRPASVFNGVTYLTGDARMMAFQTVQPPELAMDKPLMVAVMRVPTAIHAGWRARATQMALLYVGLGVVLSTVLFLHQRRRQVFQRLERAKERALRASEARLRSVFEATPDALLISDVNGTITMANQQVEVLLGYSMEELIGKSVDELVPMRSRGGHPKLRDGFAATPQARRMGTGMGIQALRKDGSECYVEVSLNRIETDEGQFFASALRDVSVLRHRQKQLSAKESALRASEARLRAFFEATPDALLISDVNGTITMANQQVEVLLGYSMQELVGKSVDELVPMRSRGGHPKLRDGFAATPQARRMGTGMGIQALRKDGSECYVEVSLNRIETDEGQFFASALRDVSVLRHRQEQLRISDQALKSISQGVIISDAQANIISFNDSFAEITGFNKTEIIGHNCRFLQGTDTDPQTINEIRSALAVGSRFSGEILNYRKDGTPFWNDLAISPVYDEAGQLTHFIGVTRDVTSRRKTEDQIQTLAYYDQLTGLPNRILLADRLKQTITASSRSSTTGALLFIDLDHFKTLNDTQGHDMGDLQLKQVATRLSNCVREGDTVARVGGDEFVVILAGLSTNEIEAASDTEVVAAKILSALSQPYQMDHFIHLSSASIGATLFRGTRTNIDELMKQSDIAMYRAKAAGRNAVRFFDPSMEMAVVQRASLEKDLRKALEQKQFVLYYQVQVDGAGGVIGAEALVRWNHPQRGLVSPAEFIPLAEETGVILTLGQWVLETACNQLEKWARVPTMAHLTVAVNVSAVQFAQSNFVEQVMTVVQRAGTNPQRLKLELTEGLLVANVDDTIGKMSALKDCGIGFSLDDFGTGFSSLAYLSRLPLDQLKIDKSFVNHVVTNPDDAAIAKTIIALAQSLRLNVIAEGVENEAQREFLANAGCNACQGYFFARPLPLEDFEAFVRGISLPNTAAAI